MHLFRSNIIKKIYNILYYLPYITVCPCSIHLFHILILKCLQQINHNNILVQYYLSIETFMSIIFITTVESVE